MSLPTTGVLLDASVGDSKPDIGLIVIGGLSSLSCRSPAPKKLFGFRSDWTAVNVVGGNIWLEVVHWGPCLTLVTLDSYHKNL